MRFGSLFCAVCLTAFPPSTPPIEARPAPAAAAPHAAAKPAPVSWITEGQRPTEARRGCDRPRDPHAPPKDAATRRGGRVDVAKAVVTKTDAAGAFQLEGPGRRPSAVRVDFGAWHRQRRRRSGGGRRSTCD
jgi:hypothetical protein